MILVLIDTSAMARRFDDEVEQVLREVVDGGFAATCVTVDLEAGYSGRDLDEVRQVQIERRLLFTNLAITPAIEARAREVQMVMATRGHHRAAGVIDLLTAAIAEHYGATVLHYDGDFEHIAAVTGQPQLWVVPRGSID